jgi:hypothetical protein
MARVGAVIRRGAFAHDVLLVDGDAALLLRPEAGDLVAIDNDRVGWPLARLSAAGLERAQRIGDASGASLLGW